MQEKTKIKKLRKKNNQNTNKKLESLNVERSTNNEYNPKFDPKQIKC